MAQLFGADISEADRDNADDILADALIQMMKDIGSVNGLHGR